MQFCHFSLLPQQLIPNLTSVLTFQMTYVIIAHTYEHWDC